MDALSEVLRVLRLQSGFFLDAEFSAPWCIDSAPGVNDVRDILPGAEQLSMYHLLTEGRCRAKLPEHGKVLELQAGDLILFPQGDGHLLGSDLQLAPVQADALVQRSADGALPRVRHGGGGERTRFVCGFLAFDKRLCRPLLGALPRMLRVSLGDGPAAAWLREALYHGAEETYAPGPGADAVLAKLSELLFVEALRRHIAAMPNEQGGWLAGVRDPLVGRALALLHGEPAKPWTVEVLARESGASRSALAERFGLLLGEPPMQYLSRWRLALAAQALTRGNDAVARIAERVGYDSEAAFNRAFKREFGMPPGTWRRAARMQPVPGN